MKQQSSLERKESVWQMTPSPLEVQVAVLPKQSPVLAGRVLVRLVLLGRRPLRPRWIVAPSIR
jgi:hypothetical protein